MYLPFLKDKKFLYMGLNRLHQERWFEPDLEWPEFHQNKLVNFKARPEHCLQTLPESIPAQVELQRRVLANLAEHHDDVFLIQRRRAEHRTTGRRIDLQDDECAIWPTSLLVQDDLCLLQDSEDGYRLTAASLCAPSYWHLEDKIGQTLDEIHQPLPGYQQTLAESMNQFFTRMKVNTPVWRSNWSVVAHSGLMQRLDTPTSGDVDSDPLWLRVERQTLLRLPQTGAICFTIRIHRYPLTQALQQEGVASALHESLTTMTPAEKNYKSLAPLQQRLQDLIQSGI